MHVGHLRASIIGEALKRIFRFRGDEVVGDAHFGDWGFQMGLIVAALEIRRPDRPTSIRISTDRIRTRARSRSTTWRRSIRGRRRRKADPTRGPRAQGHRRAAGGPAGLSRLWQRFLDVSVEALERDFHALGVDFDLWKGESDVDAADRADGRRAEKPRACWSTTRAPASSAVAKHDDKRELPPLLVVSSEGSAMYGTTDLATILDRVHELRPAT